ncbi:MAG: leucine-rich repeat domain-containing protein, partial [Alistipes sp.]|nr:leucine-rich repeat domain-containing protein [Alistipes sp.]
KYYDSRNDCNAIIETESNTLLLGCSRTIIPNTVTKIGVSAFTRCKNLTSILIPRSVTSIESGAFFGCRGLRSIIIPESVVSIGQEAFARCESLASVSLPENGIEITKDAFDGCPYKENNKQLSSDIEDKVSVTFTYKGQLDFSIEGECTLEMTAKELEQFKLLNQQTKDEDVDDVLAYFEENMEKSLYNVIDCEINKMVRYNDAKECIKHNMLDCFEDMDQDEFDSMTEEELIERFLDDNIDGLYEFIIERIDIK